MSVLSFVTKKARITGFPAPERNDKYSEKSLVISVKKGKLPSVSHTLPPTDQAQTAETLWLDLDRDVKILHDRVHAEEDAAQ